MLQIQFCITDCQFWLPVLSVPISSVTGSEHMYIYQSLDLHLTFKSIPLIHRRTDRFNSCEHCFSCSCGSNAVQYLSPTAWNLSSIFFFFYLFLLFLLLLSSSSMLRTGFTGNVVGSAKWSLLSRMFWLWEWLFFKLFTNLKILQSCGDSTLSVSLLKLRWNASGDVVDALTQLQWKEDGCSSSRTLPFKVPPCSVTMKRFVYNT